MKVKTSITLSPDTLRAIDEFAGDESNRSRVIERAVREFFARHQWAMREQRDFEILNRTADELNREADDVLSYQVEP
jgi:metal-responsive CopG/Arc/MetJ family transcriptional regulator